ncbi:MAG: hypothetical protein ABH896_02765 [Candidatus Jacksonbacteria bacterium]
MKGQIQKIESVCQEYTDHDFVQASLLGVIGILTIIAFGGQMLLGV